MNQVSPYRHFLSSFTRAQVAGLLATLADYGLLFLLTEVFSVWYVFSTAGGALTGAITNFLINRYWSFRAAHEPWTGQLLRYALVSACSLTLNTGGVFLMTENLKLHYSYSVVLVSFSVGVLFNYPLHRHFVYRSPILGNPKGSLEIDANEIPV